MSACLQRIPPGDELLTNAFIWGSQRVPENCPNLHGSLEDFMDNDFRMHSMKSAEIQINPKKILVEPINMHTNTFELGRKSDELIRRSMEIERTLGNL